MSNITRGRRYMLMVGLGIGGAAASLDHSGHLIAIGLMVFVAVIHVPGAIKYE